MRLFVLRSRYQETAVRQPHLVGAGVVDWQSIRETEDIGLSIVDEEVVEVAAPPNQPLVLHIEDIVCLCNDLVFIIM